MSQLCPHCGGDVTAPTRWWDPTCPECGGDTYRFDEAVGASVPCSRCRPNERPVPAEYPRSSQDRAE